VARVEEGEASAKPVFGAPLTFDNVAIYPVTLSAQTDPGPLVLLEQALADGRAEVREVGGDEAEQRRAPRRHVQVRAGNNDRNVAIDGPAHRAPNALGLANDDADAPPIPRVNDDTDEPEQAQVQVQVQTNNQLAAGGGATVNTLVIENKGDVPVYVLAGTVVKGGNQDRQIGQDFVVAAHSTVPVDAFCVEHGRWNGTRAGAQTGGKFAVVPVMATSKVRAAAQYDKDQGKVWSEVSKANATFKKEAASDTLLATLDDEEVVAQIDALAARITSALDAVTPETHVVGFAYAIDGKVHGARWFSHRTIYGLAKGKLVRTVAVDALAAQHAAKAAGRAAFTGPAPKADAVDAFIAEVEAVAEEEKRETPAGNDNHYRESKRAWASKTVLHKGRLKKPAAAADAAAEANAEPVPLSFDFVAK